jgi:predicted esterase
VLEDLDTGEQTKLPRAKHVRFTNDGDGLLVTRGRKHRWMSLDLKERAMLPAVPRRWNSGLPTTLSDGRTVMMGSRKPKTYHALGILEGTQWLPLHAPPDTLVFQPTGLLGDVPVFAARNRTSTRLVFMPHGPDAKWTSLVDEPLVDGAVHGGRLLLAQRHGVTVRFVERTPDGETLPTPLEGVYTDIFFHSMNRETAVLSVHTLTGREVWTRSWEGIYTLLQTVDHGVRTHMEELEVTSVDGTPVPMTLVIADHAKPGAAPVWLTSYGGFGNASPLHAPHQALVWLAMGGIVGTVHARGGNERPGWHDAGSGRHLSATFEDVIGAADHLVQAGYTQPGQIAISGTSNGGLTTMASVAERPALFGAAVSHSGVHDLMGAARLGHHWPNEYGDPNRRSEWPRLFRWSPVEKRPSRLPPVLITTGRKDPTVSPSHSYKLANAWQGLAGGPVLLRRYPWTSHHQHLRRGEAGRAPQHSVKNTEELAFLVRALGMNWADLPPPPAHSLVEEGAEAL